MTFDSETIWIGVGFLGQLMFTMRFLVQWVHSERHRKSLIPLAFWYFSLAGGAVLLTYAIWRADPVFITGQAAGIFIYLRNLAFIRRERRELASRAAADRDSAAAATR